MDTSPGWHLADLKDRTEEEQVARLIATGIDAEHPERGLESARRAVLEYQKLDHFALWGVEADGKIVGVIGIERLNAEQLILRDLAVAPDIRRQGIGRRLIDFVRRELAPQTIRGRTRSDAVEFYRRCGFSVREDGSLPSGETRYLFEWRREVV